MTRLLLLLVMSPVAIVALLLWALLRLAELMASAEHEPHGGTG